MTAVAAVRLSGMASAATMACPMDGELFRTYLQESLVPTLRGGDVVVMDNLASHKHPRVRELIESAGATLLYLPPYSPDLNPIEMIWSKVKRLLRSAAARTIETLHDAFGDAMAAVTPSDIAGCFPPLRLRYDFGRAALAQSTVLHPGRHLHGKPATPSVM